MFRNFIYFSLLFLVFGCVNNTNVDNKYVGFLKANDSINIPFNFTLNDSLIYITNAAEKVALQINSVAGDSSKLSSFIFEDFIMYKDYSDSIKGVYYNESLNRRASFSAFLGKDRFVIDNDDIYDNFSGNWHIVFNPDEKNIFDSQVIINQKSQNINGTVLTETGDYGYMEGVVRGNRFSMSNFNGYRAYMMDGYLNKGTLSGYLYTGNYNAVPFKGFKDAGFELPDPYGLTKMKDGYNEFKFSFENTEGQIVSNSDKKFDKKIMLIQLMGSWCPNCLDESRYLSKLVEKFDDIMLVSIAFEFAKNKEQALNNLKKLKNRLNINYDLLLAQYGSSDKSIALEKLESLDTLISYPTLIVVDKNKKVRRIHTGFNGPATGIKYEEFKKDFEELIVSLSIN